MSIPCPACRWPSTLDERGPSEDPSILLTGTASIGDAAVQIVAIRIDPALRWSLGHRRGVAEDSYQAQGLNDILETILEEFESVTSDFAELLGESRSSVVDLATGPYRVWVIPASFES